MNGYIFRGSNSAIFIFASLLSCVHLLKVRTCSPKGKFCPLGESLFFVCFLKVVLPFFGKGCIALESNQAFIKVISLFKNVRKKAGVSIHHQF